MLSLILSLISSVASQAGNCTANGTLDTVADTLSVVVDLSGSLLLLALGVLALALLLESLCANEPTDHFLAGAKSLVPRTFAAVGIVLGYTRGRDGVASGISSSVGEVVLSVGLSLLRFTLALGRCEYSYIVTEVR